MFAIRQRPGVYNPGVIGGRRVGQCKLDNEMAWTLTPDDALSLPVDELALHVLSDFAQPDQWNIRNWVLQAQREYGIKGVALNAVSEAVEWLYAKGLIAQRADQTSRDAAFVTRLGISTLNSGLGAVRAAERLQVDLHPLIERKIRRQFLMGEYDLAVFAAMKEVEIRVRDLAGEPDSLVGVKLMKQAFRDGGSLDIGDLEGGERLARMELFSGAIGVFKNPSSHRQVEFDDPTEASEAILLADLLLRVLDRVEADRQRLLIKAEADRILAVVDAVIDSDS
jgi:uncharacterized protein (TIGR02391 family)